MALSDALYDAIREIRTSLIVEFYPPGIEERAEVIVSQCATLMQQLDTPPGCVDPDSVDDTVAGVMKSRDRLEYLEALSFVRL